MGELAKLPNIGKVLEAQLEAVGIATPEALRETGSRAAWLRIRAADPSACFPPSMRFGGRPARRALARAGRAVKADLKEFYQSHKGLQ